MSPDIRQFGDDKVFHEWHRPASLSRFLDDAERFTMVDIDCAEYCPACLEVLRLYETGRDRGQDHKNAQVTAHLARRAHVAGGVVLYTFTSDGTDIAQFRVRSLTPQRSGWVTLTPAQFAFKTAQVYAAHTCRERQAA